MQDQVFQRDAILSNVQKDDESRIWLGSMDITFLNVPEYSKLHLFNSQIVTLSHGFWSCYMNQAIWLLLLCVINASIFLNTIFTICNILLVIIRYNICPLYKALFYSTGTDINILTLNVWVTWLARQLSTEKMLFTEIIFCYFCASG